MRPIPELVRTMLKSKSMTGSEGKPTNLVTIAGSGGWEQQETPAKIMQGLGTTSIPVSNWVKKTDGGYMCCWFDSATKQLQTGFSSDADFLNTNYAIENVVTTSTVTVATVYGNQCSLFKRNDGTVLLMVVDVGASASAKCYISNTGNGNDWVLYSTIYTTANGSKSILGIYASIPVVTSTGRIVYSLHCGKYTSGYIFSVASVAYSDDNGLTWTIKYLSSISGTEAVGQICILADNTMFFSYAYGGGDTRVYKSTDNGSNWTVAVAFSSNFSDALRYNVYGLSFYYDDLTNSVYAICQNTYNGCGIYVLENANSTDFINASKWKFLYDINENNMTCGRIYIINNALVFNNTAENSIIGLKAKSVSLPVKSIAISRNKNTAGQLTLGVDNKDGEWAPDGDINPNVLWLNKQIGVQQGYGSSLVKTFTGTIDSVDMSSFPQEITVNLRDHLKYALDQTITFPGVEWDLHSITYQWQTIEAIVTDLVSKAWMTAGEIHATGIVLQEQSFSWCKYADAFQELADLAGGYEFGCDEDGLFYFRKDSNVSPLAKGWILTFTDGAAQTLYYPIVAESDKIFDGDGVKYTRDVDYTIDYLTGAIASINIPDGATTMDYAYVSYEFVEGKDIVKLSYSLNDDAAYRKVAVYGQASISKVAEGWTITFKDGKAKTGQLPASGTDKIYTSSHTYIRGTDYTINYLTGDITSITIADGSYKMDYDYTDPNGPVVFGATDFPSRDYYNILPQKYLRINAGQSAKTSAECKAIADQTVYLMESRIRVCTFSSIGIPWLQIGDFIRVKETSTSISEIYRITDITTNMDDEGYTMDITCYHHSA